MVTENFFDLQRFADDTLAGDTVNSEFHWLGGHSFSGEGTEDSPVQMVASGTSGATAAVDFPDIYLEGSESGYNFAVSQNTANWEVAIKGASNIIGGNFSDSTGAYKLEGVATVTAYANSTEGFTENVNSQETYVKAGSADVPFQVAADDFTDTGLDYTFNNGVANVTVGVDGDDAAIFGGAASSVVFATGESFAGKTPALNFSASVTVTANDNDITYTTYENKITGADNGSNGAIMIMSGTVGPDTATVTGPATIVSTGSISTGGHFIGLNTNVGFGYAGDSAFDNGITVDGTTWKQISGSLSQGIFFVNGKNANVDNTGAATVVGEEGAQVSFTHLTTDGVVANGATIGGFVFGEDDGAFEHFAVELAGSSNGIKSVSFDQADDVVKIVGPSSTSSYVVNVKTSDTVSAQYTLSADTATLKFDAYADAVKEAWVIADNGKQYTIDGAEARFYTEEVAENGTAKNTINGAQVEINNYNSTDSFVITTNTVAGSYNTGADGVDVISTLYMGDTVNVDDDDDGYTAIWRPGTTNDTVVVEMTANDLNVKVNASDFESASDQVTMQVTSSGERATISGLSSTTVTLNGGTAGNANVYYFNGDTVSVAEGETTHVSLDAEGKITDARSAAAEERFASDNAKWEEYATLGSSEDTLNTDRGTTYEDFYDLATAAGASYTIAGYDRDNYSTVTNGESNINIIGQSPLGDPQPVADAIHVTLDVNSGDSVGAVPINIEKNESENVNDVTIDLTGSDRPSTIAIGTTEDSEEITAPHNVYLSNVEGSVAYIGDKATGLNLVQAGTGGAMMRHDGDNYRSSLLGGTGNDTIWAAAKDIVYGGGGADVYYDRGTYAIQDYSFSEGDMIIATNVDGIDKFSSSNISYEGNAVNFGNKTITLADREPGDNLFINVGFMDSNGNLNNTDRDVVLVNTANTVDAAGAGANAAIIIADQGTYANMIYGTNGVDTIYAGTGDSVLSGAGNDDIHINDANPGVVVGLVAGSGHDTVYGWSVFDGFNNNEQANRLYTGGNRNVNATYKEDKLVVGIGSGDSLTFADTYSTGYYNLLIDDTKYTVIRKDSMAYVKDNNHVADVYLGQENGGVVFYSGVTDALNIDLNHQNAQNIRQVYLYSQGKDTVRGSDARETVGAYATEASGGTKYIYMSGGNDVIYSGGDNKGYAANILMFGKGDGRDSISGFKHYQGIDVDPDNQKADFLVLEDLESIEVSSYSDTVMGTGDRVVFNTTDSDQVVIYEQGGIASTYNTNMYRVKIENMNEEGYAKIGYSNTANNFTYDSEASYYVGSADNIHDTLTIGEDDFNVEVWLDNTGNKFYRGIDVLDAHAATDTEVSLAGNKNNNTIIAGGAGTRNSLWGGAGDNLLIGGEGEDLFAYSHKSREYVNGGNEVAEASHDTIQGYTNGVDNIYVDATLADLDLAAMSKVGVDGIADDSVTLIFNNGGSLVVQGGEDTTITMSDGNAYTANRNNKQWEARG